MALITAAVLCAPVSAISADCACVMDAGTGTVLYAKNENEQRLIASTTKIMTGLLICEDCDPDREISVVPEAAGIEGSSLYLRAGQRVRIYDLLCGMMLQSGNDCAAALAIAHSGSVEAFAGAMNKRARELGLNSTHFANPHGLDDEENYSTALDLARLACAAMENEAFAAVVGRKTAAFGGRTLVNHNKLLWRCPGADGVKTGYTRAAGRILVSSAVRHGRRLICVTIHAPDDWNDHCALLDESFSRFTDVRLCAKGQVLGAFPSGRPAVCAQDAHAFLLPGEKIDRLRVTITGQTGIAEYISGGRVIAACPLTEPPMGDADGRTDPEDHSGSGRNIPQEGGGADRGWPGAGQRQYREAG